MANDKKKSVEELAEEFAAIALEHRASVFTLDKDFSRIARLTGLPLHPLAASGTKSVLA